MISANARFCSLLAVLFGFACRWCAAGLFLLDADDEEEDEAPPVAVNVRQQKLPPEIFDQWVFGGNNERTSRDKLESALTVRINDIHRVSELTPEQTQKLELAGQTDLKRIFDQIEAGRRRFEAKRITTPNAGVLHREVQPLRVLLSGDPFGERSLFDKVVRNMLTLEQLPDYQRQIEQRREHRLRAVRESILLTLDKQIPLREGQREKLRTLLAESRPVQPGQYELQAMWFVASKLPAEKYQAILTEEQWTVLKTRFDQMQGIELFLQQNGALPEE
jgi:hypothetical protein